MSVVQHTAYHVNVEPDDFTWKVAGTRVVEVDGTMFVKPRPTDYGFMRFLLGVDPKDLKSSKPSLTTVAGYQAVVNKRNKACCMQEVSVENDFFAAGSDADEESPKKVTKNVKMKTSVKRKKIDADSETCTFELANDEQQFTTLVPKRFDEPLAVPLDGESCQHLVDFVRSHGMTGLSSRAYGKRTEAQKAKPLYWQYLYKKAKKAKTNDTNADAAEGDGDDADNDDAGVGFE